ncbi:MAG: metal-dependent transcriptional regulator [Thermodesulfovibrionales bacterium]|nr:metal-dependent transcriptional regulator [Thermodesulfovibrionales bacterium]
MENIEQPCRKVASSGTEKSHFEDEALEVIWELAESGEVRLKDIVKEVGNEEGVIGMSKDGLIAVSEDKVAFTDNGRARARDITRRHRLAERLFVDVLDLKEFEEDACRLEHAISPEVEEAICTFLGHPPTCPHGKAIPRGNCCKLYIKKVRPLVQSLPDLEVGRSAKVVFINAPAMDRLASIGLVPGAEVKLLQKKPSYVLGIDETTVAIDEDIAKGIYVKP